MQVVKSVYEEEFEEKKLSISDDTTWLVLDLQSPQGDKDMMLNMLQMFKKYKDVPMMLLSDNSSVLSIVVYSNDDKVRMYKWISSVNDSSVEPLMFDQNSVTVSIPYASPIKEKDRIRSQAVKYLKSVGMIDDNSDSDDDFILGDDQLGFL